ncbi:MAG TPA: hypothetical protein VL426_02630 [Candidatus Binatia bacterium]|jgi:hypothetical protein|nr:hypothetical protein [Candidatus Binatia bacterium]
MDVRSFLNARGALDAAKGGPLRAEHDRCKAAHEAAKAALERYEKATRFVASLRRCYAPVVLFGCTEHRWLFVREYAAAPGRPGPRPWALECLIVPAVIETQTWHRPKHPPNDDGSVTMTPTPVSADDVAATAAALYGAHVRIGAFDEVLREPCAACGAQALVACEHGFDHDSGCQWLDVVRLCLACPRLDGIAASPPLDARDAHPLLPPAARRP